MPSPEYYRLGLENPILNAYKKLMIDVAVMLGAEHDIAIRDVEEVLIFETALAEVIE